MAMPRYAVNAFGDFAGFTERLLGLHGIATYIAKQAGSGALLLAAGAVTTGCQVEYTALDRDEELLKQAAAERLLARCYCAREKRCESIDVSSQGLESQCAATPHGILPNTWQLPNCQAASDCNSQP